MPPSNPSDTESEGPIGSPQLAENTSQVSASNRSQTFVDKSATETQLDEQYPNRPRNHGKSLPFHVLFTELFNPLRATQDKKTTTAQKRKLGPQSAGNTLSPSELRRSIIERFISRWRRDVGDDFYPALRLIIPEKDRDRAMYGLKEKALAKYFVKIMKIDRNSEDASTILNWKLPGKDEATRLAGDFAGRCYEVVKKRFYRTTYGDMTIDEVNEKLDDLSVSRKEEDQLPIMNNFYRRMNPEELMWLVRMILRQMKVGATEKTFFNMWHPDADSLFNVSSSLRRVCWELYNPNIRLESEDRSVNLMQCFQPQLAQFQISGGFEKMYSKMRPTEDDAEYWIEEKLDGERMQLHMASNEDVPGGKEFKFWSRKAKDYTYLYGSHFEDKDASLTQHIKAGFRSDVQNIILDGEMITWDPEQDAPVPFGTLKSAAKAETMNPFAGGQRPLFRIFDILYLNDNALTRYTLRDRRKALERSIQPVHRRLEIHDYQVATNAEAVEPALRRVIEIASEGLVLKNPRSAYNLASRVDDWLKVKPEYMEEFGEHLDCVIIGGYYGQGHRGGMLGSFLCGLRDDRPINKSSPHKFLSFFKVGGGFTANDYANVRHKTEGKWIKWEAKRPPTQYVELGGGTKQIERPDMWIKPEDSLVVEVKAASVGDSEDFACGMTLRFPRFKRIRGDRSWKDALSFQEWLDLKLNVEKKVEENVKAKKMRVDEARKQRAQGPRKKPRVVAGYTAQEVNGIKVDATRGDVFDGLTFFVMTECTNPSKHSKPELEAMIKASGGKIIQTADASETVVCIAERRTVKVASLRKRGKKLILKPIWLFDCIQQAKVDFTNGLLEVILPIEPERHVYFQPEDEDRAYDRNVDQYGDSYSRDTSVQELKQLMAQMEVPKIDQSSLRKEMSFESADTPGWMFKNCVICFDQDSPIHPNGDVAPLTKDVSVPELFPAQTIAEFAGARVRRSPVDEDITHIVAGRLSNLKELRKKTASRSRLPRIVSAEWIVDSWREGTLIDEERYIPS